MPIDDGTPDYPVPKRARFGGTKGHRGARPADEVVGDVMPSPSMAPKPKISAPVPKPDPS